MLSVVTEADDQNLTSLDHVKEELGLTDGTQDTKLTRFIEQASAICATYCNRVFGQETVTEVVRLSRCRPSISLTRYPVASITSVVEGLSGDPTTLAADEYEVDGPSGLFYKLDGDDSRIDWSATKYTVTYVGGYELLAGLPREIERACILLVKMMHFSAARDPLVRSTSIPDVMDVGYALPGVFGGLEGGLPGDVAALLDPYRRFCF
jgi:hypothetical protein